MKVKLKWETGKAGKRRIGMGIVGYFTLLKKWYPSAIKEVDLYSLNPTEIDHLYFDVNNLLYGPARAVTSEKQFWKIFFKNMDRIRRKFVPKKTLFLSVDGPGFRTLIHSLPGPRAKLLVQRNRRLKFANGEEIAGTTTGLHPLSFTPGTAFMGKLKEALCYYAVSRLPYRDQVHILFISNSKKAELESFVSGPDREGEGELKIFEYISMLEDKDQRNVVVGNDADLILFGLLRLNSHQITVLRFDPFGNNLIDIPKLAEEISKDIIARNPKESKDDIVRDFCYLSLLNGNDYLPKMQFFNFGKVWTEYVRLKKGKFANRYLFSDSVNSEFLKELFRNSFDIDDKRVEKLQVEHPRNVLQTIFSKYMSDTEFPIFEEAETQEAFQVNIRTGDVLLGSGIGSSKRAATHAAAAEVLHSEVFISFLKEKVSQKDLKLIQLAIQAFSEPKKDVTLTESSRTLQIQKYFEAMAWVMEYLKGKCVNYEFFYPFPHSPYSHHVVRESNIAVDLTHSPSLAMSPLEFCMAVLPKEGKNFLPQPLHQLLEPDSEVHDVLVSSDGSSAVWDFKDVDTIIDRLRKAVQSIPHSQFKKEDAQWLKHQPALLFRRVHRTFDQKGLQFISPDPPLPGFRPCSGKDVVCLTETKSMRTFTLQKGKYMKPARSFSTMCHPSLSQRRLSPLLRLLRLRL